MEIEVNFDIYYPKMYMLKNYYEIIYSIDDHDKELNDENEGDNIDNKSEIDDHYGLFL